MRVRPLSPSQPGTLAKMPDSTQWQIDTTPKASRALLGFEPDLGSRTAVSAGGTPDLIR
jgi:hypothetical protein